MEKFVDETVVEWEVVSDVDVESGRCMLVDKGWRKSRGAGADGIK